MENFLRYRIKRKIGAGGMATVYLAEDESLHRDVALKMIHPHLVDRIDAVRRFQNEARAIAALSHQNVVKLFDFGEESGRHYLVMEFVDGATLEEILTADSTMPNLVLLEVFSQIFSGLDAAHENGVYHRDVKPANIMIDKYGCVKIMDFGIACLVNEASLTMTGTLVGSPNFISPEQAEGKRITGKADVFSAGAVFYLCATGRLAFDGDNPHAIIHSILNQGHTPAGDLNPRLLREVSALVDACLCKDPELRPSTRQCLDRIDIISKSSRLTTGRSRVVEFCADREAYTRREGLELYDLHVESARADFRRGRWVSSLRSFSQAEQFGQLEHDDRRLMKRIGHGVTLRKVLATVVAAVLFGAACWAAWPHVQAFVARRMQAVETAPVLTTPREPVDSPVKAPGGSDSARSDLPNVTAPQAPPSQATPGASSSRTRSLLLGEPVAVKSAVTRGFLSVKTRPPFATVLLDGTPIGSTPITNPVPLEARRHALSLRRDGYEILDTTVVVASGDTLTLEVALTKHAPVPGTPDSTGH